MIDVFSAIWTPGTVNDLLAGSIAGAAQVVVGQPLDTVKTRAQIAPSTLLVHYARITLSYNMFQRGCL